MDRKPKPLTVVVEVTPEHWDHLSEDHVRQWVLTELTRASLIERNGDLCNGHRVKRIRVEGVSFPGLVEVLILETIRRLDEVERAVKQVLKPLL